MKYKDIVEKKPLKTGGAWNAMKAGWAVGKTKGPIDAVNAWKGIRKGVEKVGSEKPKKKAPGKPTVAKTKPTAKAPTKAVSKADCCSH